MKYAPVHNHTQYSALDGLATPREIAERCQCIGCTAAGITDHGTVSGHLEFAKVMAQYDIKPIFGCELYHGVKTEFGKNERDNAHFVAGAMTDEGLRNLWRMVDAASENYRYVGRVNWDICEKYREGIFATSACIQGLLGQGIMKQNHDPLHMLNRYLDIYRDNFYIEIHTYPGEEHEILNTELVRIAWERGVPLVYATDAHRAAKEDYLYADAYVAMQTGGTILEKPSERKMWHPENSLYIMDEEEIREALHYLPERAVDEALANTALIEEKCNAQLPEIRRHLPAFIPSECPWLTDEEKEMSAGEVFIEKVAQGLEARYGEDAPEEVWERAQREMEVFIDADAGLDVPGGLAHYFLQAWDFCEMCNHNGIKRGPGRGSAAGAIVSYALGITDIDPLKYDLIFERFYNPGRADGFPDIDNDFPVSSRKKVREYLMERWGERNVRTIGTIMRMKPKAVLDKTYKVCGISWDDKEELKKIIDEVPDIDILGADSIGWHEDTDPGKTIYVMHSTNEVKHDVGRKIIEWLEEKYEQDAALGERLFTWLDVCERLCSRVSGYGVHPSGVVVADVPLDDELPCMWNNSQKVQVTCFPMADVDKRGFVKQDLLGLRNLDTLDEWEGQFKKDAEKAEELLANFDFNWSEIDVDNQPEEMWEMLDKGLTLGIFQIEKGYARQLCKQFRPRSIEDLGIIVSLNRPGPIRSGAPDSFIRRRDGEEDVTYDHPILESILEPTYGWFLYQEQVIRFFGKLGYSESDADAVRKILGKKKPEQMRALRNGEGEWEGKGYKDIAYPIMGQEAADVVWSKLEDFAKYSFNKSHAIAYATIAFRTLYAKFMGPAEFLIACIRTNPDDAGDYVGEGRRMGIRVKPPHILLSDWDIAVAEDGNIYFGFSNIKGIGVGAAKCVVKIRNQYPIHCRKDFLDAMEEEQTAWVDQGKPGRSPGQQLGSNKVEALYEAGAFDELEERELLLSKVQKAEKELLGVILTDDCDEIFAVNDEAIEVCNTYADLEYGEEGGHFTIPGAISLVVPKRTKKDNKAMWIVTIEYQGDSVEFVVFPREWGNYKFLFKERTPGIFTLTKTDRGVRFEKGVKLTF